MTTAAMVADQHLSSLSMCVSQRVLESFEFGSNRLQKQLSRFAAILLLPELKVQHADDIAAARHHPAVPLQSELPNATQRGQHRERPI
jgi:hypothetical protein